MEKLADAVERHLGYLKESGEWARRERNMALDEVQGLVRARIVAQVDRLLHDDPAFDELLGQLVARDVDPVTAAEGLTAAAAAELAG